MKLSPLFERQPSIRGQKVIYPSGMRTASNPGCGFPKLSSTWFTAGLYLMGFEVKFSYLQARVRSWKLLNPAAYLHTLKLSTVSVPSPGGAETVHLLADADVSDLPFVDQLLKFLPRGVGIGGQGLVNDGAGLLPLKRNRPAAHSSALKIATARDYSPHQWMR